MWQADIGIWGRHSPVLFPIVGRLKNNEYIFNDRKYHMSQHGFARDKTFSLVKKSDESLTMVLEADENTFDVYPFDFKLYIQYILTDKGVNVKYTVENPSQEILYYSIGAHPGFICPLAGENEHFEDYEIDFGIGGDGELEIYSLQEGLISLGRGCLPLKKGKLPLSYEIFKNDAIILDTGKISEITILSRYTGKGVSVSCEDFRWVGLWTKGENAGFICIEPWNGIADWLGHDGQLINKWGINNLQGGEFHECAFQIKIIV